MENLLQQTVHIKKYTIQVLLVFLTLWSTSSYGQTYQLVKDINEGSSGIIHKSLAKLGNQYVFYVHTGNRNQVWVTNGTAENTQKILETSSSFELLTPERVIVNNTLYFYWYDDQTLYSYDGNTLNNVADEVDLYRMNWYNGALYFIDITNTFDNQLLKVTSDPSAPELIATLGNSNMKGLTTFNDQMIIMAEHQDMAWLYTSDGTTQGTMPFHELGKTSNVNWAEQFTVYNGELYFYYQSNDLFNPPPVGFYKTDGSSSGTVRLADSYNYDGALIDDAENRSVWYDGMLYTAGTDPDFDFQLELWVSDGTVEGTSFVKNLNGIDDGSDPKHFVVFNDEIYFTALKENGKRAIWKTDGTADGTVIVFEDIFSSSSSNYGDWMTVYDGHLVFDGEVQSEGKELWFSDGTSAGTSAITNDSPSGGNFGPRRFFVVNNFLYFDARTADTGRELWLYDNGMPVNVTSLSLEEKLKMNLAPNPFAEKISFSIDHTGFNERYYLIITDILGRVVTKLKIPENGRLDWAPSNLSNGVLFYQLIDEHTKQTLDQGQMIKI